MPQPASRQAVPAAITGPVPARPTQARPPGAGGGAARPNGANGHEDLEVEMEFIRAQHRFLNDFCNMDPHRLKSLIVVSARNIEESIKEIHQWGGSSWPRGPGAACPPGSPRSAGAGP